LPRTGNIKLLAKVISERVEHESDPPEMKIRRRKKKKTRGTHIMYDDKKKRKIPIILNSYQKY
jgi:hypothetical protein